MANWRGGDRRLGIGFGLELRRGGGIFFGVVNRGLVFNWGWVLSGVRGGRWRLCG